MPVQICDGMPFTDSIAVAPENLPVPARRPAR